MGFFKKAAVATAMATAVISMAGQGAFAASAGGAVGTGTITPGLPTTGTVATTTVTFDSTVLVYASTTGPTVSVSPPGLQVHFDGTGANESLNAGAGNGTLSGGLTGAVGYSRTANLVTLSGTINGAGGAGGGAVLAGVCIFIPTHVNPVDSYALVCAAATS